ncbi:hypothetical protein [Altericroceibacterium xinjiangense]|uniref:hypothetical protein n=1 Tax=Altericroceibacterium xinjiangense TaxID=762261 RepID=UPI000F7DBDA5|nr:hypothetical protein [Altericroceibacterium xinjiangense]
MSRPVSGRHGAAALRLLLVWLAVWPLVMFGLVAAEHLAPSLPFVWRTLVLTGLLVPTIALGVTPLAGRIVAQLDRGTGRGPR